MNKYINSLPKIIYDGDYLMSELGRELGRLLRESIQGLKEERRKTKRSGETSKNKRQTQASDKKAVFKCLECGETFVMPVEKEGLPITYRCPKCGRTLRMRPKIANNLIGKRIVDVLVSEFPERDDANNTGMYGASVYIFLSDGSVLEASTSEWGGIEWISPSKAKLRFFW